LRPVLWEVADIIEQIFRIACTENLHPRTEDYEAATADYQAEHGLSDSAMRLAWRQYGTTSEVHERGSGDCADALLRRPLAGMGSG
jgi:hypothetical protein